MRIALIAALVLVGCSQPNADRQAAAKDIAQPDEASRTPPTAPAPASAAPDAAALGRAIAATVDGGLGADSRLLSAASDLDADGTPEALAYLVDPMFCGTGGCTLYVIDQRGGRWTVTDDIGPAQLPIYRLAPGADGWAGLGVTIAGGGSPKALMAVPHAADGYADNPTVDPARKASVEGASLLIADDVDQAVPIGG